MGTERIREGCTLQIVVVLLQMLEVYGRGITDSCKAHVLLLNSIICCYHQKEWWPRQIVDLFNRNMQNVAAAEGSTHIFNISLNITDALEARFKACMTLKHYTKWHLLYSFLFRVIFCSMSWQSDKKDNCYRQWNQHLFGDWGFYWRCNSWICGRWHNCAV